MRIKKKAVPVRAGKPPAPGERKAMRKRIVLSNTNALEVAGLRDLTEEVIQELVNKKQDARLEAALVRSLRDDGSVVGTVVGLPGTTVDSLRASEAFKTTQGWEIFRRPALLIREEGALLSKKLVNAEAEKSVVRLVLDGERGTGKSLMLLHAMATAFIKKWVVLNIPEGRVCAI